MPRNRTRKTTDEILTETDYAYIAGFLDADGCIAIAHTTRSGPRLIWHQVRPEGVLFLRKRFQGSLFLLEARERMRKGKLMRERRQLGLGFAGEVTLEILHRCVPYLRIKRLQAETVISAFSDNLSLPLKQGAEVSAILSQDKQKRITELSAVWGPLPNALPEYHFDPEDRQKRIATPFRYVTVPSETDKAYFAGIFDGDGNLEFDETIAHFRVGQAELAAVEFFRQVYGGSLRFEERDSDNEDEDEDEGEGEDEYIRKPAAVFSTGAQNTVKQLLRDIQPYAREKSIEVDALLNLWTPTATSQALDRLGKIFTKHRSYEISDKEVAQLTTQGLIGYQKPTCAICSKRRLAGNGLCHKHFERFKNHGDPRLFLKQTTCRQYALARENEDGTISWV